MSLFQSSNPTLTQKIFDKSRYAEGNMQGVMTVRGTMHKFGFLMLMVLAGAGFTWHLFTQQNFATMQTLMITGVIGGLVLALVMAFKPNLSTYLAPAYAILEGFFLGAISVVMNNAFAKTAPNIIPQAVMLTIGVATAVYLLYNFRIIQPTQKFKSVLLATTLGIAVFYLIRLVLSLFHINIAFMDFGNTSLLGIGINLVIVVVAALNLILDFERIEMGAEAGAPKYMEWYSAFGLLVTIVWLYIELLRLLSRFNSRN